jgi:hypothetical protein
VGIAARFFGGDPVRSGLIWILKLRCAIFELPRWKEKVVLPAAPS